MNEFFIRIFESMTEQTQNIFLCIVVVVFFVITIYILFNFFKFIFYVIKNKRLKFKGVEISDSESDQQENEMSLNAVTILLLKQKEFLELIRKIWTKNILREQKKVIKAALKKILYNSFEEIKKVNKDENQNDNYDNYQNRIYNSIIKLTNIKLEENHLSEKKGEIWKLYIEEITIDILKIVNDSYNDHCPKYFKSGKFESIHKNIREEIKYTVEFSLKECQKISIENRKLIDEIEKEFDDLKNKYYNKSQETEK